MNEEYDDEECCSPYPYKKEHEMPPMDGPISDKTSKVLRAAIQDELKEMVNEELTHSMLNQVSRFANVAQELIMVRSPIADVRRRKRKNFNYQGVVTGATGSPMEENSLTGEAADGETFGAKLIRELIPALTNLRGPESQAPQKGPIEELVKSISIAKKAGLDDVVEKLDAKLHELLSTRYLDEFLDGAAKKSAAENEEENEEVHFEPIPRDKALVKPTAAPINGTPMHEVVTP